MNCIQRNIYTACTHRGLKNIHTYEHISVGLCNKLFLYYYSFFYRVQLKVPIIDKPNSTVNFRKLLLNRCQKEFEKDKVDDVVFERKQKELDSAASVCGLGNPWPNCCKKCFFLGGGFEQLVIKGKYLFHVSLGFLRQLSVKGFRKSWRTQKTRLDGVPLATLNSLASSSSSRC